jgi:type VI secretion system secreted protein Hcp
MANIYMNWNNKEVTGSGTTTGYEQWFELDSFQWGVGRGIGSAASGSDTRAASEASVSEATVSLQYVKGVSDLLKEALAGDPDKTVVVAFTQQQNKVVSTYLQFTFSDTTLSGYSLSSGGDRPSLSLSLNFAKVEFKASSISDTGDAKPNTVTYDLQASKLT